MQRHAFHAWAPANGTSSTPQVFHWGDVKVTVGTPGAHKNQQKKKEERKDGGVFVEDARLSSRSGLHAWAAANYCKVASSYYETTYHRGTAE
eukprot:5503648-Pyramimonas_sp.AAC.1